MPPTVVHILKEQQMKETEKQLAVGSKWERKGMVFSNPTELIFPITTREVQKVLARVCDYLGYEGISTHSFRKWYATEIYRNNGYDIALVQRLLQHSSAAVTQRYIGIEPQRIEKAIEGHAELI